MIKNARLTIASWSTFGQTALLIIAALLIAQVLAFFLVRNIIDEWQRSYVEQPAINRFADVAKQISSVPVGQRRQIVSAISRPDERFWLANDADFGSFGHDGALQSVLVKALAKRDVRANAVVAFRGGFDRFVVFSQQRPSVGGPVTSPAPPPPDARTDRDMVYREGHAGPPPGSGHGEAFGEAGEPGAMVFRDDHGGVGIGASRPTPSIFAGPEGPNGHHMRDLIRLAALMPNGEWLVGRFEVMQSFPLFLNPIFLSQVALFIILLAGTLFWASRISRPLRILARAAEGLRPQEQFEPIPVEGPRDVQAAINSFNTMALRVRELLHEKDRMLSAIGHDLRTPLAALRIRAESIEPENEREKIIETLNEMTQMVDEILALARLGYSTETRQLVDLSALADAVVEEFTSLGQNVVFLDSPKAPLPMQVGLMRRLLRNLIDNAVKYGHKAQVSVLVTEGRTELVVEDEGPGIPAEQLSEVLQPFTRIEQSRSRLTGGSGLGLTIADAIARSQGASLQLENRATGGLKVVVRWHTQRSD